jgi:hypothetical protein
MKAGLVLYGAGVSSPTPKAKPFLVADGWRKRSGDFYTRPTVSGVAGLLCLSPDRGLPYQWYLRPFVGVVHERVNAVAQALTGGGVNSPYPLATIRYPLVKLLDGPQARDDRRWLVVAEALDGNERVFRAVADAAREFGLPWIEKRTSLDAVIYELQDGNGGWRLSPFLTAALWMKGDVAAAEACLGEVASRFDAPPRDIPARLEGRKVIRFGRSAPPEGWPRHQFDAFADRLRRAMAQYPGGPPEGWIPQDG